MALQRKFLGSRWSWAALLAVLLAAWFVVGRSRPTGSAVPYVALKPAANGIEHPDFRGVWQLDLEASDSLVPILEAKGRNVIEQTLAANIPITHTIDIQDEREMIIKIGTPIFTKVERMLFDGSPLESIDLEGNHVEAKSTWSDDGQTIVTNVRGKAPGDNVTCTIRRSLTDKRQTMYVDLDYRFSAEQQFEIRRIFRRVK